MGEAAQQLIPEPASVRSVGITPMEMINTAIQKGVEIEKLQQLFDLQQRWEQSEAKKSFTSAMADFKANAPTIPHDKIASFVNSKNQLVEYSYSSLANACEKITKGLAESGISHSWDIKQESALIRVTCTITHSEGHSESVTLVSNADTSGSKNSIQSIASTITYLERYTLLAVTGTAAGDLDDDGTMFTSNASSEEPEPEFCPEEKFESLFPSWKAMIEANKKTPDGMIAFLKTKGIELSKSQETKIKNIKVNK